MKRRKKGDREGKVKGGRGTRGEKEAVEGVGGRETARRGGGRDMKRSYRNRGRREEER